MATRTQELMAHRVDIKYDESTKKVVCTPPLLYGDRPNHVRRGDTIKWTCNKPHWAVVFGPDAPFREHVLGNLLANGGDTTTVTSKRPGDFHKHKYTVFVWTDEGLAMEDPEVDVDED